MSEDFEPTDKEVKHMAHTVGELQTKLRTAVRGRQETKLRKSEQFIVKESAGNAASPR
jgi:hypothetical protein